MFAPLIELDLFLDVHNVPPGPEPGIDAPRERVCRMCATEVLLYGLKDWWVRERTKGFLDASVTERPDCPDGPTCRRQKEHGIFVSIPFAYLDAHIVNQCSTRKRMCVITAPLVSLVVLIGDRFAPLQSIMYSTLPPVTRYQINHWRLHRPPPRYPRETHLARLPPKRLGPCARMPALTRRVWWTRLSQV